MNTAGNPLHVLGLSWAGGLGDPAPSTGSPRDVASATGATLVLRRSTWEALGGFPEPFFAYQEDLELSWRAWQRGWRVRYVPGAVVVHHYAFSRNPCKMYLLERNRLLLVLTTYGTRTLLLLAPALLGLRARDGSSSPGCRAGGGRRSRAGAGCCGTCAGCGPRRAEVQAARTVPDRGLTDLWVARFSPSPSRCRRARRSCRRPGRATGGWCGASSEPGSRGRPGLSPRRGSSQVRQLHRHLLGRQEPGPSRVVARQLVRDVAVQQRPRSRRRAGCPPPTRRNAREVAGRHEHALGPRRCCPRAARRPARRAWRITAEPASSAGAEATAVGAQASWSA